MATGRGMNGIIIMDGQDIERFVHGGDPIRISFAMWDGNVFSALAARSRGGGSVTGLIRQRRSGHTSRFEGVGSAQVLIEVVSTGPSESPGKGDSTVTVEEHDYSMQAWVRDSAGWSKAAVRVVPVRRDLFSRARGLLETGVLAGMVALIKGLGSVGSTVARLLAQSGVCHFLLMDDDRLDVSNMIRHEAGLSHIGRFKTRFMADLIHEKNPYAQVETFEMRASESNMDLVRELVDRATLCIDTGDEREGKLLLNRVCLEKGTPLVISGAFRRAHGGQVLRVLPGRSACYACFTKMLAGGDTAFPDAAAEGIAYSDRPMPIEPGLSIDIDPISHMTAKVVLQELLRDVPTTLRSLDEDLVANWFLYLNRREAGTQYEGFEPLGFGVDGMRILRWYGVEFERDPACPMCGSFATTLAESMGVTVSEAEVTAMRSKVA